MAHLVLLLGVLAFTAAQAQPVPGGHCDRERCALRLEPVLFGIRVVRGSLDAPTAVDPESFRRMGPDADVFAATLLRETERRGNTSALFIAGLATTSVLAVLPDGVLSDRVRIGIGGVGIGLAGVGLLGVAGSDRGLSRAIWEYNQSLSDS